MALRLKKRHECPPNGFQYTQPETGWHLETWDFNFLCMEVQKHRRANPKFKLPTDMPTIEAQVDNQNAMRVAKIPGAAEVYLMEGDFSPPKSQPPTSRVRRLVAGARVIVEWITSKGQAVDPALSNHRASICSDCPKNEPGDLTSFFTIPVSEAIRSALNLRKDWKLSTNHDERLNVCDACGCPLKLKVHVPIDFINKRLSAESRSELDPRCWILGETKPA